MLRLNVSKIIASVFGMVVAAIILLGANSAFAADTIHVDTHTTGARSRNQTSVNVHRNHSVSFTHRTNIDNDLNIDAYTGGNRSNYNTGYGYVRSGDVNSDFMIRNSYSSPDMDGWFMNNPFSDSGYTVSVNTDHTGYGSTNDTNINLSSSSDFRVDHRVDINNDLNVTAYTGNNQASGNTGNGYVSSGDVNIGISVDN